MKFTLILLVYLIFSACSSAPRFTSDSDKKSTRYPSYSLLQTGIASYYADQYHGKKTASGEIYNMHQLTAAHPDLPFDTILKVTNLKNNKTVIVRINDRMPDFKDRIIDLSFEAAKQIDMISDGIVEVKVEIKKQSK